MTGPSLLVLHHGACPRTWTRAEVEWVHLARGFRDVGYHDLIRQPTDRDPVQIILGRPYDLDEVWEPWEYGAHARGNNRVSYGVCLIGNFHEERLPDPMLRAAVDLFAVACRRWGLDERAVKGHKELSATACPGKHVDLEYLRVAVRQRLIVHA